MPERRLISFEELSESCEHSGSHGAGQYCYHPQSEYGADIRCMAENCPIWARLEREGTDEERPCQSDD
jgi:hypothetical protein